MKDKKNYRLGRIERGLKDFLRSMAELREEQKKTDEEIKSLTRKTDEEIKKVNDMVGRLTDGWGKFVEGLVEPSLPVVFAKLGFRIPAIYQRAEVHKDGETLEIDLLGVGRKNGKPVVLVVEAKSQLGIRDVKDFEGRYRKFKEFFREYESYQTVGVVCGARLTEGVVRYGSRRGFYVLGVSGNVMVLKATPRR